MPQFFLMPDCKDGHVGLVNAVPNNISAVTKVDQPFPELFRKIIDHSPEVRVRTEYLHALPNSLTSPTGRIGTLGAREIPEPLQVPDRPRGEYHLWHSGAGSSSSDPQLASH